MSLRTWLIKILGGQTAATIPEPVPADRTISSVIEAEQIATTVPNTVMLSTDLQQLLLIAKNKVTAYDLSKSGGISVGLRNNEVTVLTKTNPNDQAGPISTVGNGDELLPRGSNAENLRSNTIRVDIKEENQFTLTYNRSTKVLGLIGATDIIQTFNDDEPENKQDPTAACELHLFSLEGQTINFSRQGLKLTVSIKP